MSALPPKADPCGANRNVRFGPIADIGTKKARRTVRSRQAGSPNAREKPPSDPRGVIRIARKLYPQKSVLHDGAIEQKRHAEDHNERGREPRSERGSACCYDQNPGGVSGMADEGVGPGGDHVLAAVGLDTND